MKKLLFLIAVVFIVCCKNTKNTVTSKTVAGQSKITFFFFKISRDSASQISKLSLVEMKDTEGETKNTDNTPIVGQPSLLFIFKYATHRDSLKISHPLYQHIEYLDHENNFRSKDIILPAKEFFIRYAHSDQIMALTVIETIDSISHNILEKTFNQ